MRGCRGISSGAASNNFMEGNKIFSIQVISVVDRYWVECALELRQGVVPSANVAPVLLPPLQPGQQVRPWKTLLGHFWTFVCSGVHREGRPACETSRGHRSCQR